MLVKVIVAIYGELLFPFLGRGEVWHREWMGFRGWVGLVSTCTSRLSGDFFFDFFWEGLEWMDL